MPWKFPEILNISWHASKLILLRIDQVDMPIDFVKLKLTRSTGSGFCGLVPSPRWMYLEPFPSCIIWSRLTNVFLKSLVWGTRNVLLYLNYIVCTIIIVVATNTSMPLRAGKTSCPLFSHCFIIFFCLVMCWELCNNCYWWYQDDGAEGSFSRCWSPFVIRIFMWSLYVRIVGKTS